MLLCGTRKVQCALCGMRGTRSPAEAESDPLAAQCVVRSVWFAMQVRSACLVCGVCFSMVHCVVHNAWVAITYCCMQCETVQMQCLEGSGSSGDLLASPRA